jgi:hypothetical protein
MATRPSESVNSIAGSDEVLYRPIGFIQVFLIADYGPLEQPIVPGRNSWKDLDARFSHYRSRAGST